MNQKNSTAMDRALTYIGFKERTVQEVADYLKDKGYSEDAIAKSIEKLKVYGYLGDERYVNLACQSNALGNRYGKNRLIRDLRTKGIDESLLMKAAQAIDDDQEEANAQFHYQRAYAKFSRDMPKKKKDKIANYLMRRGFSLVSIQNQFDKHWNIEKEENGIDSEALKEMVSKTAKKILSKRSKRPLGQWELKNKIMQNLAMKGCPIREVRHLVDSYFEENWEESYENCNNRTTEN